MNPTDFVDINEQGLVHFDNERYMEAVQCFRAALARLNAQRQGLERATEPDQNLTNFEVYPIPLEFPNLQETTVSPDGQFSIFDVAILFEFADIVRDYPFIVGAILYNLALTLHVDALQSHSPVKLWQAKEVYRKALDFLQENKRATLRATQSGDRRVLFLALANNYGHCCSYLSDRMGVERSEMLLGIILSDSITSEILTPKEFDRLRMSCMMGLMKKTLPPVAAAA